jgi:nucleotide-binding universal stress UspA family protein
LVRTVVVGYDGSEQARDAIALGALFAREFGSSLVVAVIDEFHIFAGAPPAGEERAAYVRETLAEAAADLGDHEFRGESMWGSVPECLELITKKVSADLLVIGSTHRGEMGRVLPGSVADRLLAGSLCAVAVAPKGFATKKQSGFGRIGVGFDGEEESMEATRVAAETAIATGASLRLVAVAPAPVEVLTGLSWGGSAPYLTFLHEQLEAEISKASAALPAESECTGEVVDGDPADVLRGRSDDFDLLVLGSRGYGPLRRVFLGGVSCKVIRGSSCPVLITPRSARRSRRADVPAAAPSGGP